MNINCITRSLGLSAALLLTSLPAQHSITVQIPIDYGSTEIIDVNTDTWPNGFPYRSAPLHITAFRNGVLFSADMGFQYGRELWFSDGTAAGTRRVKNLYPLMPGFSQEWDDVGHIAVLNDRAFFAGRGANGIELWVTDGTEPGTMPFADINPGPDGSMPQYLTRVGQEIFFSADDGTHGVEPWVTDGQTVRMVADAAPGMISPTQPQGSHPRYFAGFGETPDQSRRVVFLADNGADGEELWFTDGSAQNTYQLVDILPGQASSQPRFMTPVTSGIAGEQRVVFSATCEVVIGNNTFVYRMPWATDFTPQGTVQLVQSPIQVLGMEFVQAGHEAYFMGWISGAGYGVWRTDGTQQWTRVVYDGLGGAINVDGYLTPVGSRRLYAAAQVTAPPGLGYELMRVGTQGSIEYGVFDIEPGSGSSEPRNRYGNGNDRQPLAVAGNKVFMTANKTLPGNPFFVDHELVVVDNGATAQPEHWGCGSSSLESEDPVIGSWITMHGRTRVPNATNLVILTRPGTPTPIPGFTGCQFFGSFNFFRPLDAHQGSSYFQSFQIPNDTSLHLQTFIAQAVSVSEDPVTRFDLSNPVRLVVGTH